MCLIFSLNASQCLLLHVLHWPVFSRCDLVTIRSVDVFKRQRIKQFSVQSFGGKLGVLRLIVGGTTKGKPSELQDHKMPKKPNLMLDYGFLYCPTFVSDPVVSYCLNSRDG